MGSLIEANQVSPLPSQPGAVSLYVFFSSHQQTERTALVTNDNTCYRMTTFPVNGFNTSLADLHAAMCNHSGYVESLAGWVPSDAGPASRGWTGNAMKKSNWTEH